MDRNLPFAEDVYDAAVFLVVGFLFLLHRFVQIYAEHYAQCLPGIRYDCGHTRFVFRLLPTRYGHISPWDYAVRAAIQDFRATEMYPPINPVPNRQDRYTRFTRYWEHRLCTPANWRFCRHSNGDCFLPFRRPAETPEDYCLRCEGVELRERCYFPNWDFAEFAPVLEPQAPMDDFAADDFPGPDDDPEDDEQILIGAVGGVPAEDEEEPEFPLILHPHDPLILVEDADDVLAEVDQIAQMLFDDDEDILIHILEHVPIPRDWE